MRKRSIPQVRKGFAAPTRPTREVWRSITICTVKIVCYVGSALFLFSLIMQLSFLYPSLWLFPPLWVDRIIIAMIGSYLLLKGWLSLQEFRLEREQSRAQSTSNLEPIALNKSYTLLYPWWIEHWLQPFTVIVHPPAQDPENQERTVMQRLASPIVSIRIRLFDTFCLILVGADGTQVEFTLRKRKPRYAALIALLALDNEGAGMTQEHLCSYLYPDSKFANSLDSFRRDRKRLVSYVNSAALTGGLLPIEEQSLFVKDTITGKAVWKLSALCEIEALSLLRSWDERIRKVQTNGTELDPAEVRQGCEQLRRCYARGLLKAHWHKDTLSRDPAWWWIEKYYQRYRNIVISLLLFAAQQEVDIANQQPQERKREHWQQAARYYFHCMVLVLTGIPDLERGEQALENCKEICTRIKQPALARQAQQRYEKLLQSAGIHTEGEKRRSEE